MPPKYLAAKGIHSSSEEIPKHRNFLPFKKLRISLPMVSVRITLAKSSFLCLSKNRVPMGSFKYEVSAIY